MKRVFALLTILLSLQVGATRINTNQCTYAEEPKIIEGDCGESCALCVGKISCDLGAGPVVFRVSCTIAKGETGCPDAGKCARMSSVSFTDPNKKSGSAVPSGGTGGSDVISH